jgi:hypothetical protein
MNKNFLIGMISACALALSAGNALAAKDKVYTWTDEKGVVHYGERPPKDSQATLIKTRTGHSEPTPVAATPAQNTTGTTAPTTNTNTKDIDPERCNTARKNLELLNTVARIRVAGEDGNMRTLTEEDKATQRTTMQTIIDEACE